MGNKLFLVLGALLFVGSAKAYSGEDLRTVDALDCQSQGLGYFSLIHLKGDAQFRRSQLNPITITDISKKSISIRFKESHAIKYTLTFNKTELHEDGSRFAYQVLVGNLINGDNESPIECSVITK